MPDWGGILQEMSRWKGKGKPFDPIRRKYLAKAHVLTKRDIILYATNFTDPDKARIAPESVQVSDEDLQGIMAVMQGLEGPNLDLILHSPGGDPDAAEALVTYLRTKFRHIRVIVPSLAMSAATMIACSADAILMGKHSFLGPIDPQLVLNTPLGIRNVPAAAVLDQFDLAKEECNDPTKLVPWVPMLSQYGPDLLVMCKNSIRLSEQVVRNWLGKYMFAQETGGRRKAARIAKWLASHTTFKSHGRHLSRDELERKGLNIVHLEKDQGAQDVFLSVFHATAHTFNATDSVKIIENHNGKAFIKRAGVQLVPVPAPRAPIP